MMRKKWNKFIKRFSKNFTVTFSIATIVSFLTFASSLFYAFEDGRLTAEEVKSLLTSSTGIELVVLLVAWLLSRNKK